MFAFPTRDLIEVWGSLIPSLGRAALVCVVAGRGGYT